MKKNSLRSLYQIKNMVEQEKQFKRYMRLAEAVRDYQLDRRVVIKIATEAEALYKVNSVSLIDMDAFEDYFAKHYRVKE